MPVKVQGGKLYKTVAERVNEVHADYKENVSITTEIIDHIRRDDAPNEIVMQATVTITTDNGKQTFIDYAQEFQDLKNPKKVNATSYLENCITSSIGRALAAAGYSGSEYASADEVQRAMSQSSDKQFENLRKENDELGQRLKKAVQIYRQQQQQIEAQAASLEKAAELLSLNEVIEKGESE